LRCEAYRRHITVGLVASVGGVTEHTARHARKALAKHLHDNVQGQREICLELLELFDRTGYRDKDPEPKRMLASLLNTVAFVLSQGCFAADLAPALAERALSAVRSSGDVTRLRASIAVFIGLLQWPGDVRRRGMYVLLQFLGYSFPVVRQATAKAIYLRLLEETGELDLRGSGAGEVLTAEALQEALGLISVTPWSSTDEEALAVALREVYRILRFELPSAGRSILAPKRSKLGKPHEPQYADLVKDQHY
jgi:hypothetical protein